MTTRLIDSIEAAFKTHFNGQSVRIKLRSKPADPGAQSLKCLIDRERIVMIQTSGDPIEVKYSLRSESGFLNNKPMGPEEKHWFYRAFKHMLSQLNDNMAVVEIEPITGEQ